MTKVNNFSLFYQQLKQIWAKVSKRDPILTSDPAYEMCKEVLWKLTAVLQYHVHMLICTYVYGIAIPASKINLRTIMGDYKSSQNSFPYEISAIIPNTSYYRLMKRKSRTHAQHHAGVTYGKGPDTKFKYSCFL